MQAQPAHRGHLNDLHKEIDYLDRKIAHSRDIEKFDSETARGAAVQKLVTKRGKLVKIAAEMTATGMPFDPKYLPRSFKTDPPQLESKITA